MDEPFPQSPGNTPAPAPAGPGGTAPGSTHGEVGGPRHYSGPTLGQLIMWKCVACGAENTGDLGVGCTSCGSGSAKPYHVATPPPVHQMPSPRQPLTLSVPGDADAFEQWLQDRFGEEAAPTMIKLRPILQEAWEAAILWYRQQMRATLVPNEAPSVATTLPGSGVLVPSTLLKKVIDTLEQVFDLPEDQQSPELIAMIAELKELSE